MNDINNEEFQSKVEQIIEKYLNRQQYKAPVHVDEIAQIEKEFQKVKLVKNIINQFTSMIEASIDNLHDTFQSKLDAMDCELMTIKELVLQGCANPNSTSYVHRRNGSQTNSLLDGELSNNDSFLGEEKPIKDLKRHVKDMEEQMRRKLQSNENHISILMDLQLQLKSQMKELQDQVAQKKHKETHTKELINRHVDSILEERLEVIRKILYDSQVKEKVSVWTVVNDLSEKIESLKQYIESTIIDEPKLSKRAMLKSMLPFKG